MKKFESDESSADEGEISNSEDESGEASLATKPSKRKIWSNVVLDQAADDIVKVNTFSGNSGSRNVESYGTYTRKRKRSESDNESKPESENNDGAVGMEAESAFDSLLRNATVGERGGKRRKVVYDVSNQCSEDEDLLNSVDALDNKKSDDSKKAQNEMDISLGDAIMESSRFLHRVDTKGKRPPKTCSPEAALSYLTWVLNESNEELLKRLLRLKTVAFAFANLEETIRSEREGGIMTNSGIRRRLPGGVFIAHLKKRLTEFERMIVLDGKSEIEANRELDKRKKRKKASAQRRQKKRKALQQKGLVKPPNIEVQDLNDLIVETVNADENGINSDKEEPSAEQPVISASSVGENIDVPSVANEIADSSTLTRKPNL